MNVYTANGATKTWLYTFFTSCRVSVICLQRPYDFGRPRESYPHCSPDCHSGVRCHRIPSPHCVMEQIRWEKYLIKAQKRLQKWYILIIIILRNYLLRSSTGLSVELWAGCVLVSLFITYFPALCIADVYTEYISGSKSIVYTQGIGTQH